MIFEQLNPPISEIHCFITEQYLGAKVLGNVRRRLLGNLNEVSLLLHSL